MARVIAPHDRSTPPATAGTTQTDAEYAPAATAALELVGRYLWRGEEFTKRTASAIALAGFRSPMIAEIERLQQLGVRAQFVTPIKSVVDQVFGASRWMQQQNALWRSAFAVPSISVPWWTYTDLWPTNGLMTSLMRPLDVVRPHQVALRFSQQAR